VVALAPGTDRYNKIIAGIKKELKQSLPSLGVILNPTESITLTGRGIPDDIIKAIKRKQGRDIDSQWLRKYAIDLRQQFPGISKAMLAQILTSIEGVDSGKVQSLLLEQEEGAKNKVGVRMPSDDSATASVTTRTMMKKRRATAETPAQATPQRLTKSDLAVLKRVERIPRGDQDQRKSA
jgi:hypothetical protein